MSDEGQMASLIDAFICEEGNLDCPACDGSVERRAAGKLECDMCARTWTDEDVIARNRRRMS